MRWDDDKVKRFEKYAASLQEKRLTRVRHLVRVMVVIVVLGLGAIVLDVATRNSVPKIRIDFIDQAGTITEWKRTGFMKSADDSSLAMIVDEATWLKISGEKRLAIASLLQAYYGKKGNRKSKRLIVTGNQTGRTVASIEMPVLVVE